MNRLLASALLLLGLAGTALATTKYVDGDNGHDTNYDGTSMTIAGGVGPYKTITKALTALTAAGSHTIYVQGTCVETRADFGSDASGKNYTVQNYNGQAATLSSDATEALKINTTYTSGTIIWDGVDVVTSYATTTGSLVSFGDADQTIDVTIKNCTLQYDACVYGIAYMIGATRTNRNITFENVDFVAPAGSAIRLNSAGVLTMTNCRYTSASTARPGLGCNLSIGPGAGATFTLVDINGCTFTTAHSNTSDTAMTITTPAAGTVRVRNSAFTGATRIINCPGVSGGALNAIIENNTFTTTGNSSSAFEQIVFGSAADVSTNTVGKVIIRNNTFVASGGTAGVGGVLLGPQVSGAIVERNIMKGQIVAATPTNTTGIGVYLRHSDNSNVIGNSIAWGIPVAVIEGDNDRIIGNTLYTERVGSHGCIAIRDSNAGRTSHTDGTDPAGTENDQRFDPIGLIVRNNVMMATGNLCIMIESHGDRDMVKAGWQIDNNVYYVTGDAKVARIDFDECDALSDVTAWWTAAAAVTDALTTLTDSSTLGVLKVNDENSVEANPDFLSSSTGDLRIGNRSAAKPTYGRLWQAIGAWGRENSGRRIGPLYRDTQ